MLKKVLTKSGLRILKAIKKLSTKNRSVKKSEEKVTKVSSWHSTVPDHEAVSLSWSLASLDTKSVDTYLTSVSENVSGSPSIDCVKNCCCCCCAEYEENQRNENRENEMFV